jgi:hypothetical protein
MAERKDTASQASTAAIATAIPADTEQAVFLGNPHLDNLMTVVIALGAEIWSDRQRMRIMERLLESRGKVTQQLIEQYVPSNDEKAAWDAERAAMVKRVYEVLSRDTSTAQPFSQERRD